MILFPAIDLKDGRCVRLLRGDLGAATVFNIEPADQARAFELDGCRWLHMVDLNGAVEGRPVNAAAVESVLKSVKLPLQLGGGIRNLDRISQWLDAGVRRVILGTVAVTEPQLVKEACRRWPGRIVVGIDARQGVVAVDGWTRQSQVKAMELALRFEEAGVAAIVYTDIDRDGALEGVNVEQTVNLAMHLTTPVIASGGVSTVDDLIELKKHEAAGVVGVIVGRALYDGRVSVREALAALGGEPAAAGASAGGRGS